MTVFCSLNWIEPGHLTVKSDVYSFGVVLLELLSGRRAMEERGGEEETIVDWAKPFLGESRRVLRIMDTRLEGQYSRKGAQAVAELALQCLHTDPKNRPLMKDVLATLESLQASRGTRRAPLHNLAHRDIKSSPHNSHA